MISVEHYGLDRSALAQREEPHIARAVAAWLCRRHSDVPLRELAPQLGLSRADSVPILTRRMDARLLARPQLADELQQIMARIEPDTKNQVRHQDLPNSDTKTYLRGPVRALHRTREASVRASPPFCLGSESSASLIFLAASPGPNPSM